METQRFFTASEVDWVMERLLWPAVTQLIGIFLLTESTHKTNQGERP